jgi:hypothetical protein
MEKRFEIKYEVNNQNFFRIYLNFLKKFRIFKEYETREVFSLYYDDLNLNSLFDNVTGVSQREKFRLRWYDKEENISDANFEIKKKKNKLTTKEVIKLKKKVEKKDIEYLFLRKEIFDKYFQNKLINKIFLKKINNSIKPRLITNYKRDYFKFDNNLRFTFDYSINYKIYNDKFEVWKKDDKSIIEVKCKENKLNYYKKILKDIPLITKRNSKYVKGMAIYGKTNYF